jgi:hypothetical protein
MADLNNPSAGIDVSLNRKEYRLLVQMIYRSLLINESLVNQDNAKEHEEMCDLAEKIISYAADFDSDDIVARDMLNGTLYPSANFYGKVMDQITEYDEITFWEEITQRLADRDTINEHGMEIIKKLSEEEYLSLVTDRLIWYTEHFKMRGLDDVKVEASAKINKD